MMEHRFPLIPGIDASGAIESVGPGVEGYAPGDEVVGGFAKMFFGEGTFAELTTIALRALTRKPPSIEHRLAAAIPHVTGTAFSLLEAIEPAAGETVLAYGASGGVGSLFVQLATARGASVIGVCSGPNLDYVRARGAVEVIDYTAGDLTEALRAAAPDGIDAIADMVGDRDMVTALSEQLRPGGRVALVVGGADEEALARRGVKAANVNGMVTTERLDAVLSGLVDGALLAPELTVMPLADSGEAIALVGAHHTRGKVVIDVS